MLDIPQGKNFFAVEIFAEEIFAIQYPKNVPVYFAELIFAIQEN